MAVPMTAEQANAVFDVLVKHIGVSPDERRWFVHDHTKRHIGRWVLGDSRLGPTGHLRRRVNEIVVDANWIAARDSEEVRTAIEATNAALAALKDGVSA
jgi:polyhydroxyalkanoate synthesis regulator phasin